MTLNITKGAWSKNFDQEYPEKISIECDVGTDIHYYIATVDSGMEQEANADLIIEAGTVANECGLTPRQLLGQRDELLEALELADAAFSGTNMNMSIIERKIKAALLNARNASGE